MLQKLRVALRELSTVSGGQDQALYKATYIEDTASFGLAGIESNKNMARLEELKNKLAV